jgi:hypothetical protein
VRNLEIEAANPRAGLAAGAYQAQLENQHGIRLDGVTDVELLTSTSMTPMAT